MVYGLYLSSLQRVVYLSGHDDGCVYLRDRGVNVARYHTRFLVLGALEDALRAHAAPTIVHSDQGSEYESEDFTSFVRMIGVDMSMSAKASPWQNAYKESFYSHFKSGSQRSELI